MPRTHRGTRNRSALGGRRGTISIIDRASYQGRALDNPKTYGTSNWNSRRTFARQGAAIIAAKKSGIIFSSFPGYVKATDLKTDTVAFGRDAYSAFLAQLAANVQHGIDSKIIKLQREQIFREAGRQRYEHA